MRESTKYLLGGAGLLGALSAFVAIYGWPQRMGHVSPQAIGLFLIAFGCLCYGAFLRLTNSG